MTRARCFALAVLIGAWCLSSTPGFAQSGPPPWEGPAAAGPDCPPGVSPVYRTPQPLLGVDAPPWYGSPDDPCYADAAPGRPIIFDGGFLRAEFLHWELREPGQVLLGAPLVNVANPREPFVVFSPVTGSPLALARVPSTDSLRLEDTNGVRVTGGCDFVHGNSIEVGAFFMARNETEMRIDQFPDELVFLDDPFFFGFLQNLVGTSTLVNGQVSDNVLLYNRLFTVDYQAQLWGADANYLYDLDRDGLWQFRPLLGVKYLNLHERMLQTGVFQDEVLGGPALVSTIDSVTFNNLYGPQLGARAEIVSKYIQFGAEPKLLLLANSMKGEVTTNDLRSFADPTVYTDELTTGFSLGFEIGTYAQINFSHFFSARIGYNFLWLNRVTRPADNIFYNDNGPLPTPPGVTVKMTEHNFWAQGLTLGGEFRF